MIKLPAVLILAAALGVPAHAGAQEKEESVRAAAKLTGITSGMAMACGFDSKPVLYAYRDFLDRRRILGPEREGWCRWSRPRAIGGSPPSGNPAR